MTIKQAYNLVKMEELVFLRKKAIQQKDWITAHRLALEVMELKYS